MKFLNLCCQFNISINDNQTISDFKFFFSYGAQVCPKLEECIAQKRLQNEEKMNLIQRTLREKKSGGKFFYRVILAEKKFIF